MAKNLIIGIPNKGRLQKDTEEIFLNSGLKKSLPKFCAVIDMSCRYFLED